jgi:hypothetical protein
MDPRRTSTRALAVLGAASGVALLTLPKQVVDAVAPAFPRERLWLVRLLGARLVAQHGAILVSPSPRTLRVAAAVDGLHAASMLPLLALPRYRRAALVSGGVATFSTLAARRSAGSGRR